MLEETGLTVQIGKPLYVGEWHPVIKDVPHQIVALFMVCTANTDIVRLSDEHDHAEWVTADSWHKLDVMPPDDKVLRAYFADPQ
ncbi:MAG TPA: NUDIX domain-containing protein [Candidatus Saccharimonadales bacterium]|nr:NUDIX domain-containing protein [Candidatus Saccharimonadales bacterium]